MTIIRRKRLVCVKSEQVIMMIMMTIMMTMTMPQVVVGDVLKLSCDQEVPCDAIVLSSDHSGGQVGQAANSDSDKDDLETV